MPTPKFAQSILKTIHSRLEEKRRFIQVLFVPRQVGKTTLKRQFMAGTTMPYHYASADEPSLRNTTWTETPWEMARLAAKKTGKGGALLILDEAHRF